MLSSRLSELYERLTAAAARVGRDASTVRVLAVTKTRPRAIVDEAIAAGLTLFGENRVQEASSKYENLADRVELHLIGHLQSNKAKLVPGLFSWVESIDSLSIAEALSRRCEAADCDCSVLLQFNSSGERSKSGFDDPSQLRDDATRIARLPRLRLRGVMTIGPLSADASSIAGAFGRTRELYDELRRSMPEETIDTLSMGMSDDFEIAIAEGSTQIRVGSVLFGARS